MNSSFIRCLVVTSLLVAQHGFAQSDRAGTWEMGATVLDHSSVDLRGLNGSSLSIDDEIGFGFNGAYNFTERLAVGFDLTYSNPKYRATLVPDDGDPAQTVRARLGVNVVHVKGIFNLLENDITPFVEIGAGWTYVDSNIVSGPGGSLCWWDPWWGYICESYFDTYSDTRTSISYALGVRWDIDSSWTFKASWGTMEVDKHRSSDDIELDTTQISFGWRF